MILNADTNKKRISNLAAEVQAAIDYFPPWRENIQRSELIEEANGTFARKIDPLLIDLAIDYLVESGMIEGDRKNLRLQKDGYLQ